MRNVQKVRVVTGKSSGHPAHDPFSGARSAANKSGRAPVTRSRGFVSMLSNNLWLLAGMTVVIAALMIAWLLVSSHGPGETRAVPDARLESRPAGVAGNRAIDQLEERLAGLVDRLDMMTDSITYLESKLIRAHVITDYIIDAESRHTASPPPGKPLTTGSAQDVETLPPSAAGQTSGDAVRTDGTVSGVSHTAALNTGTLPDRQSAGESAAPATPDTPPVTKDSTPVSRKPMGGNPPQQPWVVNLSSLPSQADADRFAAKAWSRGIETQQQQVTVKDKEYWRVQTTGFPTAEEAHSYAGIVSEKLGLRDVWITRR